MTRILLEERYEVYGLVRRRAEGATYTGLKEMRILDEVKLIKGRLDGFYKHIDGLR